MDRKKIQIVAPVHNEEALVDELVRRLGEMADSLAQEVEFLLVDDGSRDGTLARLLALRESEPRLKVVQLSRNWGHQAAFNAGLSVTDADAVVLMDGDLEDPPEMILELVRQWEAGAEIVYTVKESREESWLKKRCFDAFYSLIGFVSNVPIQRQAGMFSLLDRRAAEHLKSLKERNKFYVGLRSFLGFRQVGLPYRRQARRAGTPKQTVVRLFRYAMDAIFSFSFLPIRLFTLFGAFLLVLNLTGMAVYLFLRLWGEHLLPWEIPLGFTTLVTLILGFASVQILFLGVVGEYVARIFDEVRARPYFLIDRVHGSDDKGDGP